MFHPGCYWGPEPREVLQLPACSAGGSDPQKGLGKGEKAGEERRGGDLTECGGRALPWLRGRFQSSTPAVPGAFPAQREVGNTPGWAALPQPPPAALRDRNFSPSDTKITWGGQAGMDTGHCSNAAAIPPSTTFPILPSLLPQLNSLKAPRNPFPIRSPGPGGAAPRGDPWEGLKSFGKEQPCLRDAT